MRRPADMLALPVLLALLAGCRPGEPARGTAPVGSSVPAPARGGSSWTLESGGIGRTASTTEPGPRALPGIAWTNPVAKEILSEPVFGMAAGRPAVLMSSNQEIVAFDLENGKLLWSHATPSSINACPVVVGDSVWVLVMDGLVYEISAKDGKLVKEIEMDFTLEASPLVVGGRLIFEETSQSARVTGARLHALDLATGTELWKHDREHAAGRAAASDGRRVFFAALDGMHAVELADGKAAWSQQWPLAIRSYSPIVVGTTVVVAHGSYGPGELTAADAGSGALLWQATLPSRLGAPAAATDTEILVPVMDGKIHRYALKDGAALGTLDPGGRTDARPVISADRIYVPVGQTVVAFARDTLAEAWRLELESMEVSNDGIVHMAVMGSRLIVVRLDGHVHALESPAGS